ncbi:uncharacterized protein LOC115673972 [Syzygium oleosum]|uniref:uncharacterized protein LOC115673972 n=1 Tax=Syzygium oleosum TaxID=219896 RepID=UPI0011D23092|nr:uncharacterized protein LOC115673972 [Syzygium oleosum]
MMVKEWTLLEGIRDSEFKFEVGYLSSLLATLRIEPEIQARIKALQSTDLDIQKILSMDATKRKTDFQVSEDGILKFRGRLCVPNDAKLKEEILNESGYSQARGKVPNVSTSEGVALQARWTVAPLEIPEWKWEHITMDFVMGLPRSQRGHDSIWVIVDRLTKLAHFLAVRKDFEMDMYAELYMRQIVHLHGVPVTIMSDRDPKFTATFWKSLQMAMGTKL